MNDELINKILADSQPQLVRLFEGSFGEEIEGEAMQELIASVQMYAATCMRTALLVGD